MNDDTLQHTTLIRTALQNGTEETTPGFTLTVIRGSDPDYGALYSFTPKTITIGRSTLADLRLNDHAISKKHCSIRVEESSSSHPFLIEDLGSTNGTRLNGIRLTAVKSLNSGDRIELGDTILRFNTQNDLDSEYQSHLLKLATTDPLTSMLNKASLQKELDRLLQYAHRYERPLSILMLDIDHFKSINDNHGHLVGDQILQQTAQQIRTCLRQHDIAGRFGGEEFTILLPETLLQGAMVLAERIRECISSHLFHVNDLIHRITVSIGVADRDSPSMTVSELLELADHELYRAKNNGRNQTASQATLYE